MTDHWVRCPDPDEHEPHQYAIRAGSITVAGGLCEGKPMARAEPPSVSEDV